MRVRITFSIWLVSCYAHVYVRLQVAIVMDRETLYVVTEHRVNTEASSAVLRQGESKMAFASIAALVVNALSVNACV